ncbi:MAG: DUF3035 domain-containing protein [Alphaproteobacteria bacterium]|nr:DUF3035 domain-containing protein [Alphaproteobacteria bacterium]
MASFRSFLFLGVAALLLSSCGELREDLGLGRNPPDEFAVVDRPPLSVPPDFGLRPPRPGAPRPQAVSTAQQAQTALLGEPTAASSSAEISSGEKALLDASGAAKATPDIRALVDREAAEKVVASPHLIERLTNWSDDDDEGAVVVDAAAESARLKKAKEADEPLNKGATPIIERQKSGWLGL